MILNKGGQNYPIPFKCINLVKTSIFKLCNHYSILEQWLFYYDLTYCYKGSRVLLLPYS
nr:MAG TPA_asm: hypothetical protein [Bacteriophage sp.]